MIIEAALWQAVEQFAEMGRRVSDADLERPWAWRAYDDGVRRAFLRTGEELRELAVLLAERRATSGPRMTTAQRVLAQYHLAYRDLQAVLIGVDQSEAGREPAAEEWPIHRTLGHIVDAQRTFFALTWHAVARQRGGDRPLEMAKESVDEYAGPLATFERVVVHGTFTAALAYHDTLHGRIIRELSAITDAEMDAPSLFWEEEELPVRFRLLRFEGHLREHTIQLEKTRAMLGHPLPEALRQLRLIYAALAEAEGAVIGAGDMGTEPIRAVASEIIERTEQIAALRAG